MQRDLARINSRPLTLRQMTGAQIEEIQKLVLRFLTIPLASLLVIPIHKRQTQDMTDSISSLTPSQAAALEQLQAITNGSDPDVAIDVLASVGWDVQVSRHATPVTLYSYIRTEGYRDDI